MSRIGKLPISIPAGVTVTVSPENVVTVKGPKGELSQTITGGITVSVENGTIEVARPNDEKQVKAYHGLYRALINNMVQKERKNNIYMLIDAKEISQAIVDEIKGLQGVKRVRIVY